MPIHAVKRAKQRYDIELTCDALRTMADDIDTGHSTFVKDVHEGREIHLVKCHSAGRYVPVIYEPASRHIVTVLPDDCRQLGFKKPRGPRFHERDDEWTDEPAPDADPAALAALATAEPNNMLADRLKEALEMAGWGQVLAQNSPSDD